MAFATDAKQQAAQSQEKFIADLYNQEMISSFTRNLPPKHGTGGMTMADLIDRDAVLSKLKNHADLFKGSTVHDDIVRRDEATAAIAEIINAPAVNHWIPCSERLPEKECYALIYFGQGTTAEGITDAWYDGKSWNYTNSIIENGAEWEETVWIPHEVTHWMPLPEPPEKE
jgi:hypothetical protein